ncbi:hypothetical protein LZK76_13220 [Rhizobium leguminosarum]|nr:hypothetical protein LZK76_13220 [Rhizobium leguminosarum]
MLLPAIAFADPTGSYKVAGTSEDGSKYQGTVKVLRNGETYIVDWMIGKNESIGTGLGAKFSGDRFEMGPASDEDTAISVGYVSRRISASPCISSSRTAAGRVSGPMAARKRLRAKSGLASNPRVSGVGIE